MSEQDQAVVRHLRCEVCGKPLTPARASLGLSVCGGTCYAEKWRARPLTDQERDAIRSAVRMWAGITPASDPSQDVPRNDAGTE